MNRTLPVVSLFVLFTSALHPEALAQTQVWSEPTRTQSWSDAPAPAPAPSPAPVEPAPKTRVWSDAPDPAAPPPKGPSKTGGWSTDLTLPHTPEGSVSSAEAEEAGPQQVFKAGDEVFVGAPGSGMSYPGVVGRVGEGRYYIRYSGTIAPSDGWADARQVRRPPHARSEPELPVWVEQGVRLEVSSKGQWYLARVLEVSGAKVKVRYERYDSSWDEWVAADRIRPVSARAPAPVSAEPTGRFVCQIFEENQMKPQGEVLLNADGTYRDLWNRKTGTWTFDRSTRALRFRGGLANGARATYDPEVRAGKLTFDWGNGVRRECYR